MSPTTGRRQPSYPGAPRSRRAVLQLGLAGAVAAVVNACGGSSKASTTTSAPAAAATAAPAAAATAAATTVAKAAGTPVANPIPTGSQMAISFTFTPGDGGFGRVRNPYTAVWIEDAKGILVRTVQVTFNQREQRYLQELRRWFTGEQGREAAGGANLPSTVTSATRVPGDYSVVWDGLDDAGTPLGLGDYFVCVEAAREHGPYELVRDAVTVGKDAFDKPLTASGEIPKAAVSYKPA